MANGRQALLAIRVTGDVVGEISALNDTARTATVTSCGDGLISVIHKREWHPFLHHHPEAALALAKITAARFRWANRRRIDFASYPAKIRLARVLAELSMAHGERVPSGRTVGMTLTQPELATLCGAAEPTIEKALRELREAGVSRCVANGISPDHHPGHAEAAALRVVEQCASRLDKEGQLTPRVSTATQQGFKSASWTGPERQASRKPPIPSHSSHRRYDERDSPPPPVHST